jgi:hypothetical protein
MKRFIETTNHRHILRECGFKVNIQDITPPKGSLHDRFLKPCLHWQGLPNNAGDSDSHYLLALATLGDTTQIGLFLFLDTLPKVTKASTVMTVACHCR